MTIPLTPNFQPSKRGWREYFWLGLLLLTAFSLLTAAIAGICYLYQMP